MDIESLKIWFKEFKLFSNDLTNRKLIHDLEKFRNIISGFINVRNEVEIKERKITSDYNVFYLMKYVLDKEEITHSPFIADILNINGKHRQESLFYDEFIKQLDINNLYSKFEVKEKMFFSVNTEKWTGEGSIDIFIEYHSPIKHFAIAIENKIFAKDQPKQLERYAAYLEKEFGTNFLLLYLTPRKRFPEMPYSISKNKYDELEKKGLIKLITYEKHISLLFENTIPKIESHKVTSIAKQYLQTIKNNFRNG